MSNKLIQCILNLNRVIVIDTHFNNKIRLFLMPVICGQFQKNKIQMNFLNQKHNEMIGEMWEFIVLVPDNCLSFYFTWNYGKYKVPELLSYSPALHSRRFLKKAVCLYPRATKPSTYFYAPAMKIAKGHIEFTLFMRVCVCVFQNRVRART